MKIYAVLTQDGKCIELWGNAYEDKHTAFGAIVRDIIENSDCSYDRQGDSIICSDGYVYTVNELTVLAPEPVRQIIDSDD